MVLCGCVWTAAVEFAAEIRAGTHFFDLFVFVLWLFTLARRHCGHQDWILNNDITGIMYVCCNAPAYLCAPCVVSPCSSFNGVCSQLPNIQRGCE